MTDKPKSDAAKTEPVEDLEVPAEQADDVKGGDTAIVSPRDPASGLPTGKRMHKPYTV